MPTNFETATHRNLNYATTRWQRFLFSERSEAGSLHGAVGSLLTAQGEKASRADASDFAGEVFARLYDDPAKLEAADGPAWTGASHEILSGLPEWDALRENVAGDPDLAALAAAETIRAIAPKVRELQDAAKQEQEERKAGGSKGGGIDTAAAAAAVRSALRKAIGVAHQRVADAREALEGLAPGLGAAPPAHEQQDAGRMTLAERLLRDPRLRDVLRKAGRIQRLTRADRKVREQHSRQEVVDVERGADLGRMLPAALARLRHPIMRKLALRDIVERQAPQYRLEGKEPLGRGPIVVMLDRSGSMSGEPEAWASAAAIALIGAGVRENRKVTVVEFTTTVDTATSIERKTGALLSPADPAKALRTGLSIPEATIGLATRRSAGGTAFGPVLRYGLGCGALDDRADLIFVTDGLASADPATLAKLTEAKGRGLRVWALTVNGGSLSPAIEAIADAAVDLDGAEDIAAAIASAMPA